ncbi:MAG: hypothetical protein WCP57_06490 [Bacteroidota bacterium]
MGALKQENYNVKNASIYNPLELQHMAEKVFREAIQKANQNKTIDALDLAQEALAYANMSQSTIRINIHRFLGFINLQLGKLNNARIHCYHALQALNIRSKSYIEDKDYFEKMMQIIEMKMKSTQLVIVK